MSTIAHITARATQIQRRPDRVQLLTTAKVALAALLAATLVLPAAGGFHGQALWLRCIVYPAGLALVPAIRLVRRSGAAYPLAADTYLLVPFAFDACGNTLGLYGGVDNFDNI